MIIKKRCNELHLNFSILSFQFSISLVQLQHGEEGRLRHFHVTNLAHALLALLLLLQEFALTGDIAAVALGSYIPSGMD